jgi:hypothetical protein
MVGDGFGEGAGALRRAQERSKREEEDRQLLAAGFLKEGSSAWRTPGGVPCSRAEGLEALRQRRHRRRRDEGGAQQ